MTIEITIALSTIRTALTFYESTTIPSKSVHVVACPKSETYDPTSTMIVSFDVSFAIQYEFATSLSSKFSDIVTS